MQRTISIIVQFFLSTNPFCWGVYLATNWCLIPACLKKLSPAKYFIPRSIWRVFIQCPFYFSTLALNSKVSIISDLCFKKWTYVFWLKSSMKIIVYLYPRFEGTSSSPQRSEKTNFNSFIALQDYPKKNTSLYFFLTTRLTHIFQKDIFGKSNTIYLQLSNFKLSKLICPKCMCYNQEESWMVELKHEVAYLMCKGRRWLEDIFNFAITPFVYL